MYFGLVIDKLWKKVYNIILATPRLAGQEFVSSGARYASYERMKRRYAMMDIERSKRDIKDLLYFLRVGTPDYERSLQELDCEMQKSRLSLDEVGTSEVELEALRIQGCGVVARDKLAWLRSSDHMDAANSIPRIRTELHKGGLSLADIGTNEEELERLRIASVTNVAKLFLRDFRRGRDGGVGSVDMFRALLASAGLTLAAVGTREEELDGFSSNYEVRWLPRAP